MTFGCLPQLLCYLFFLRKILSQNLKLTVLARLSGQLAPGIDPLAPPLPVLGLKA